VQIATQLVERGALQSNGQPDQAKIDRAFVSAIRSAKLAGVELVWNAAGPHSRPSMSFEDIPMEELREEHPSRTQRTPVIMLISVPWYGVDESWQGLAVAKWLVAKGLDPKTVDIDGNTLLNVAMHSGDGEFVRWALEQGLEPAKAGDFDLGDYEIDEDTQLALLEAGYADKLGSEDREELYAAFERYNRQRAMAWLVRHPPK